MTHWPATRDIASSWAVTPACAAGCLTVVALVMVGMTAMTAKMRAVRNPGIAIFRFIVNSTSANSKNGHPPGIVRAGNAIARRVWRLGGGSTRLDAREKAHCAGGIL